MIGAIKGLDSKWCRLSPFGLRCGNGSRRSVNLATQCAQDLMTPSRATARPFIILEPVTVSAIFPLACALRGHRLHESSVSVR